jgi:hypothetical protein
MVFLERYMVKGIYSQDIFRGKAEFTYNRPFPTTGIWWKCEWIHPRQWGIRLKREKYWIILPFFQSLNAKMCEILENLKHFPKGKNVFANILNLSCTNVVQCMPCKCWLQYPIQESGYQSARCTCIWISVYILFVIWVLHLIQTEAWLSTVENFVIL